MHVDLGTFRKLSGSTFNDPIFNQFAVDGVMSRDKLLELAQTTDCFLSFDEEDEAVVKAVTGINSFLQSKGLITWYSTDRCGANEGGGGRNSRIPICGNIDRTRSFIFFLSRGYAERVCSPTTDTAGDRCFTEFNYALRRKFPDKMVPVILDAAYSSSSSSSSSSTWPGILGPYFGPQGGIPGIDFSSTPSQQHYQQQQQQYSHVSENLDTLFHRLVQITRAERAFMTTQHSSGHSPVKGHKLEVQIPGVPPLATREEAQFYLWMTRSAPNIGDLSRTMYCSALTHLGVTTVQKLAEQMTKTKNFLILHAGAQEHDADEIALAISDLGLGYNPIRDFSTSTTIESGVYAMKKACLATGDPELAANALGCLARIVFVDPVNRPRQCMTFGLCDPAVKLMSRYLGDASVVENACRALEAMAADPSGECAERLGDFNACDIVPRALQSHLTKASVMHAGLRLIAVLSKNATKNKMKFGTAGACDVVCRGVAKHVEIEEIALHGCDAMHKLAYGYGENVGKLAYSQGCEILTRALAVHGGREGPGAASVAEMAFKSMILLAVDAEYRGRMGAAGACEATIAALEQHAATTPSLVECGLVVHNTLIIGNANNRNLLGRSGACELVHRIVQLYDPRLFPTIIQYACTAIYSLASGSPDNQRSLLPLAPYLQALLAGGALAGLDDAARERLRPEAQEALIRLTKT